MKKIIVLLVSVVFFTSCSKKVTNPIIINQPKPEVKTEKKSVLYLINATPEAISKPVEVVSGIKFNLDKKDLTGAVTSFISEGDLVITPISNIQKQTSHENGAIVLDAKIDGGDIIHVAQNAGWVITSAIYEKETNRYPIELQVTLEVPNGKSICMKLGLDTKTSPMRYKPQIDVGDDGNPIINSVAGFQFADCSGKKAYINDADVYLDKLFIELRLDDQRKVIQTGGVKLPSDY